MDIILVVAFMLRRTVYDVAHETEHRALLQSAV